MSGDPSDSGGSTKEGYTWDWSLIGCNFQDWDYERPYGSQYPNNGYRNQEWQYEIEMSTDCDTVSNMSGPNCYEIRTCQCWCGPLKSWRHWSPIIIDVTQFGGADTLSGTWKRLVGQDTGGLPNYDNTRLFDLDGNGLTRWSWVGPRAGLLVYSASGIPKEVTGKDLFGNVTWGQSWKDGYEPLATLDVDENGALEGKELELLYIWLDANTNAKPDEGEVKPVSEYLTSISVVPTRDEDGNAWNDQGATLLDGTQVGAWDWWTKAYRPPVAIMDNMGRTIPAPVAYTAKEPASATLYTWSEIKGGKQVAQPSGFFRFIKSKDKLYVMSAPVEYDRYQYAPIAEVTVSKDGTELSWNYMNELETKVKVLPDGTLAGESTTITVGSQRGNNKGSGVYAGPTIWTAKSSSVLELGNEFLEALANVDAKNILKFKLYGFSYIEPSQEKATLGSNLLELLEELKESRSKG
jgi:hypothetical protein